MHSHKQWFAYLSISRCWCKWVLLFSLQTSFLEIFIFKVCMFWKQICAYLVRGDIFRYCNFSWWVYLKELKTTQKYLQSLLLLTRFRFVQLLTWLFSSKLEVHFFIVRQADRRAIKAQSYIQQLDDHRDLFTLDDRITVIFYWLFNAGFHVQPVILPARQPAPRWGGIWKMGLLYSLRYFFSDR